MIKSILNKLTKYKKEDSLVRDNFILFSANMILNAIGFLYHFFMGRILGPSEYGVLGALMSLVYILIIPINTIQTTVTKFVSNLKIKNEFGKIKFLLLDTIKKFSILGVIIIFILLILSPFIASFLKISLKPLIIVDLIFIFSLLLPITRGTMQGLQSFKSLGINNIFEGALKIIFGLSLVFLGLGVVGAISGVLISYAGAFFLGIIPLRYLFKKNKETFSTKDMYKYSLPVLIGLLSLTAFYSIDILLVKHFFTDLEAGYYSAISLIGRTIFYATFSISLVMFPKVSELHTSNGDHKHLLKKSLLLVLLIGAPMVLFYFIFSSFIVNLFFGSEYLFIKPFIALFGLIMIFYSLTNTLTFYNLSINKRKFLFILIFFNVLQISLIYFFHNSIMQIIIIFLILMISCFISLLGYTLIKNDKTINNNPSIQ